MNGPELRDWIDAHGYTVSDFARAIGVSRVTVHRWLSGQHRIPASVEMALRSLERR